MVPLLLATLHNCFRNTRPCPLGGPPPRAQKRRVGVRHVLAQECARPVGVLDTRQPPPRASCRHAYPPPCESARLNQSLRHADMPIRRHVKVRGSTSPYDGNLVYWAQRLRDHPLTTGRIAILLKRQRGVCASCGLLFTDRDSIEVDHVVPRSRGGSHDLTNMQALHRHCHDRKSATDGSLPHRRQSGVHDKDRMIEEPDDANVSRPVLKTSRSREGAA